MARIWSSGFELNSTDTNLDIESTSAFGLVIQSSVVRSGTYAMQVVSLVAFDGQSMHYTYLASEATSKRYFRLYLRVATLPSAENRVVVFNDSSSSLASPSVYLTLDETGDLRLYDEDGQIGSESSALSLDTWYRIEILVDTTTAAGSHEIRARIDGSEFAGSNTRDIISTNQPTTFAVGGNLAGENQTQGNWYIDDLAINDDTGSFQTSYPGDGAIIHLRPSATGDNSDWTGDNTDIDEVTPDDTTTKLSSNTLDQLEDVNLDASGLTTETINVVAVGARFNGVGASANASFALRVKATASGTVEESSAITPANTTWVTNAVASPRNYPLTLYDLPGASTTAWTPTELDTAQIGIHLTTTSTNAVQVSTLWMLVDYTLASDLSINKSESITLTESTNPNEVHDRSFDSTDPDKFGWVTGVKLY